jgi:fatty-acyl-CoA synthase
MKISFSTLGCPDWSWDDILSTAKDLGFDGIEIRGLGNEMCVPKAKPFISKNIKSTKDRLEKLGLKIPCLTSSCLMFDKENKDLYIKEGKEYIDLASSLGIAGVRFLGDPNPGPGEVIDIEFTAGNFRELANYADGKNVKVLVETNGIFASSDEMLKLLKLIDNPNVGVLWDIHHPYRFMNEAIDETYSKLKEYIDFVHIKDSIIEEGKIKYKMVGQGSVPVQDVIQLLIKNNFEGFVSLEWVKRWCLELEEPGIVFSHFINYMRKFDK